MKTPICVRDVTEDEQEALKNGLRSKDPFEIRRSQIVLASARKETARRIARTLGCHDQTVRQITASELVRRVSAVFEHPVLPYLTLSENVS